MNNPETGYSVVSAFNPEKPDGKPAIFKGVLDAPKEGKRYKVKFVQEHSKEHGAYFKIRQSETELKAQSVRGVIEYLVREGPNLGEKRARELVEVYGVNVIDVLAKKANEVWQKKQEGYFAGLTEDRLKELSLWAAEEKSVEAIKTLFYGLGITPSIIGRIIAHFGRQAPNILKTDPFRFKEVDGIGFQTAWMIAKAAGCPKDNPSRIRYGILHMLEENESNGHCCMSEEDLIYKSQQLLDVPKALVVKHLAELVEQNKLCNSETNPQSLSQYPELFDIVE